MYIYIYEYIHIYIHVSILYRNNGKNVLDKGLSAQAIELL